jgi:hypothetical protein
LQVGRRLSQCPGRINGSRGLFQGGRVDVHPADQEVAAVAREGFHCHDSHRVGFFAGSAAGGEQTQRTGRTAGGNALGQNDLGQGAELLDVTKKIGLAYGQIARQRFNLGTRMIALQLPKVGLARMPELVQAPSQNLSQEVQSGVVELKPDSLRDSGPEPLDIQSRCL